MSLQLGRFPYHVVDYPLHYLDYPIETNMTKYDRRTERSTLGEVESLMMFLGFRLRLCNDRVLTQTYIGYSTLSESLMTTKYTYDVFQGRDTYFNTG